MVTVVITGVVILAVADADTTVITNVLLALGLGGGLGVLTGIQRNVNGNLTSMVRLIETSLEKLHQSTPKKDGE